MEFADGLPLGTSRPHARGRLRPRGHFQEERGMTLQTNFAPAVVAGQRRRCCLAGLIVRAAAFAAETTVGFIYVGSRDDYGYNQAHAAGRRRAQEDAGHQGRRGGEGAGDRRGREDHGVHDQSRRRDAAVPDFVRLLQPAHDQDGQQISEASLRALRRPVDREGPEERRQLFRLHRRGAVRQRHRRRLHRPSPASSASSPPSRSRRCCATSTPSRWAPSSPIRRRPCR